MDISIGMWSAVPIHEGFRAHRRFLASKLLSRGFLLRKTACMSAGPMDIFSLVEFDVRSSLNSLQEFLMAMPSTSAMGFLAIALTAVAGTSIAGSKSNKPGSSGERKIPPNKLSDYWLLTLNPSPFNRFVVARWPSIIFDSSSPDDSYEKMELSSHQVVSVRSESLQGNKDGRKTLEYQRKCIWTEDGGSLALDWPAYLDLDGDHGLDTTLLLIPGTFKGSEDEAVKIFAQEALQSGYFSVVLNPRGCGNSPLTTPRIFSAGDSDDVRTAVSYIARCRPWTTFLGIGWGFGANMLAKYLGEENLTPLTAAVCINNPFDLDEATKYMKRNRAAGLDRELTDGLVQILRSNKFLFQGQANMDITGGLAATSVREFEAAVSCPARGFKSLESYYRSSSSRNVIDGIQTPLLCIQDSTAAPPFSIPQNAFEENPFTTLLYSPNDGYNFKIVLEWLAAVEIALLKGRHPLLRGIDLAIKPSKGWSTNLTTGLLEEGNEYITLESKEDFWAPNEGTEGIEHKEGTEPQVPEVQSQQNESQQNEETEQGQAKQAAQTVFSALDMAMPGTLSPETKEQVLDAVGRGETVITALQNAVPEDVRGKMAAAVSAAVQTRGISLKLVGFGDSVPAPTLPKGDMQSTPPAPTGGSDGEGKSETTKESDRTGNTESDAKKGAEPAVLPGGKQEQPSASDEKGDTEENKDAEAAVQNQKRPENTSDPPKPETDVSSRNPENTPAAQQTNSSINVQQAFQAFSGFDDSTQMAVNNVFGLLEGMLDQIESGNGNEAPQAQGNNRGDTETTSGNRKEGELVFQSSANFPLETSSRSEFTNPEVANAAAVTKSTTTLEQVDEVKDVHTRLKKTKISGFVLHDCKGSDRNDGFSEEHLAQAENIVLEAMKVEVRRRLGSASPGVIDGLKEELPGVARAAIRHVDTSSGRVLSAEGLVDAVASAFRGTIILQKVVPFGVLVGVILASLVNSYVVVTTKNDNERVEEEIKVQEKSLPEATSDNPVAASEEIEKGLCGNVVGAVTAAAMGATAAFASSGSSRSGSRDGQEGDGDDDCYKDNIVTSMAEKAFSIAAPVVPTKDGQVDHERLISMLADIGQKAGFLNVIGKAALLWGGLRGAMNVTERLLVFFKIAAMPLHRRLLGFSGMVLLLWSPIFLPLLPTLLTEWASHSSGGVAQCACVFGFYGALILLIIIWGKKIRGFDQPLHQYGLRLKRLNLFGAGLAVGCGVVCLFYVLLSQLRYLKLVSSFLVMTSFSQALISIGKLAKLTVEALAMGVVIAPVEELIFRSWLLEEISVDFGEQKAILLSSLLFAIVHWSPSAIPGLWFMGVALAGARVRSNGNLALPIGLHAGLIAANFVLTCGGFVVYSPKAPCWLTGLHASSPLAGVFGAAIAGAFAALLFPWKVLAVEKIN
ncbi:uncharacterized protein LOC112351260 [Selaginella moellendorffii]|uniref:uncharacterized protein LOC112351260 n=1 Tax=Selaginella moellendorffii TaxID=88036 RepID=UPI000D1CE224|nr:uncharacterized protein LOC112351260 [Selaginella moellendorffii]|eukprot:XP_024544544.1 uncharacterized protein LOC112351260 [Selaginella moellendorffii]